MHRSNELRWRWLRYAASLSIPASAALAFSLEGAWSFVAIGYAFCVLPAMELVLRPNGRNLEEEEREVVREDGRFDAWLWSMVAVQWGMLMWFWVMLASEELLVM